ncbi:MAG: NADH:ubiquinone reductase (Na(+)-transporting) subunit C [Marinilabiliaceae bacterium]|nr:NADH:ubiquinone reductase (Na(+)-transporting) subunit C [Marinilabiliaceae bacterium]
MKNFSNTYIFIFATIMVAIVALVLSTAAMLLQPRQEKNAEIEKKRNILASVGIEASGIDAETLYDKYITSAYVINNKAEKVEGVAFDIDVKKEQRKPIGEQLFPIYVATLDNGSRSFIMPLEGKGLWGPIWGYMALNEDLRTIYGVTFDHKSETPGLGAEINTSGFEDMFKNKTLFEGDEFKGILVQKGGANPNDNSAVDAISGGTITSKALEAMIYDCMVNYVDFLKNYSN